MSFLIPTFDLATDFWIWSFGVIVGLPEYGSFGLALMVGPFILSLEW